MELALSRCFRWTPVPTTPFTLESWLITKAFELLYGKGRAISWLPRVQKINVFYKILSREIRVSWRYAEMWCCFLALSNCCCNCPFCTEPWCNPVLLWKIWAVDLFFCVFPPKYSVTYSCYCHWKISSWAQVDRPSIGCLNYPQARDFGLQ